MERHGLHGIEGGRGRDRDRSGDATEWIGTIRKVPRITGREPAPHPMMALWCELPGGKLLAHDIAPPDEGAEAAIRLLRELLQGEPGGPAAPRPARIRVESDPMARAVRDVVGDRIPVAVEPSAELDELITLVFEVISRDAGDQSYFEHGDVPAEAIDDLFQAAHVFHAAAPWQTAAAGLALRMDVPELGIEGACVSLVGGEGFVSPGFLIFPSLEGLESFLLAPERPRHPHRHVDVGTPWLSFALENRDTLPETMRREIDRHGWTPAPGNACPVVRSYDRHAQSNAVGAIEVELAWRCAMGLSTFVLHHAPALDGDAFSPVSVSIAGPDEIAVRFTIPYEAYDEFEDLPEDEADESDPFRGAKRNDPCPCGSGRKFKKCHLPILESTRRRITQAVRYHQLDALVLGRLTFLAEETLGEQVTEAISRLGSAGERAPHVAHAWLVYDAPLEEGGTVAAHGIARLEPDAREWAAAQQQAWFSIWEVLDADPGRSLVLRDLLTGEQRTVMERDGSHQLVRRDAILCRVVDFRDLSLMCAVHPRVLLPGDADELVRRACRRLRRRTPPPPLRLRDGDFSRYLIRAWDRKVRELERRPVRMPQLANMDGDPLLFTTDHFDIAPGGRHEVEERLSALPEVAPPCEPGKDDGWTFHRPAGEEGSPMEGVRRVLGKAYVSETQIALETNSVARADVLCARIEQACGSLVRHREREHGDAAAILGNHVAASEATAAEPHPPELLKAMFDLKCRHYASWIDQPLPALDGRTPREAARSPAGRRELDVLLKEMEHAEQRCDESLRFDFSEIRRSLHLE